MRFPLAGTVDGSIHEKHEDQHMNIGFVDPEQFANRIRFTLTKLNSCVSPPLTQLYRTVRNRVPLRLHVKISQKELK